MKIQIDTTKKTVKVEESVNLGKLVGAIQNMLPDWKLYILEIEPVVNWTAPIIIREYTPWWNQPLTPMPWIIYQDTTGEPPPDIVYTASAGDVTAHVTGGVYNLQLEG